MFVSPNSFVGVKIYVFVYVPRLPWMCVGGAVWAGQQVGIGSGGTLLNNSTRVELYLPLKQKGSFPSSAAMIWIRDHQSTEGMAVQSSSEIKKYETVISNYRKIRSDK